jgi:uncharacterized glyoxalase superfamily protein PhnB
MATDPLDTLREPVVPIAPRESFAAELRGRLVEALGLSTDERDEPRATTRAGAATGARAAGASAAQPAVSVYLCAHDAAAAIDFYRAAFDAVETMRMTGGDGRIGHAEITIGGNTVMLSDEHPEIGVVSPQSLGGTPVTLHLLVDDVDAVYERALAAGATGEREPADQFHGNRTATLRDPFGHRWMLTQPIEAVTLEELAARAPDYTLEAQARPEPQPATTAGTPSTDELRGELGYFTLSAPDVERAAAFYGPLFGWRFDPPGPGSGGHTYSHVGNTSLPFGFHDDVEDRSPHHYYRVEDLAAMVARVRELGGEVLDVTDYAAGATARCRDDQGIEFDLWQPAPGY